MKIKTSELQGAALDWAVAKCEEFDTRNNYRIWVTQSEGQAVFDCIADDWEHAYKQATDTYPNAHIAATEPLEDYTPSTNWSQGGPIIEREKFCTPRWDKLWQQWHCFHPKTAALGILGPTPLIAAMRCYVTSKIGDEVDIPEELL